jgi:hypothetical protein
MPNISQRGTPAPGISNEAGSISEDLGTPAQRRQDGGSEYAMRRDASIAENRQLLASLGLSEGGSSAIRDKLLTKKGEKGKGKEKGKGYAFCLICTCYQNMFYDFFRSPTVDGGASSTTSTVSPSTIQQAAAASSNDLPALTSAGDG